MNRWLHRLSHWFGLNRGGVVTATDRYRNIWVGYRCAQCGRVCGKHISRLRTPTDGEFRA